MFVGGIIGVSLMGLPGMPCIVMTRRSGSQRIIVQLSWLMQSGHHCWFMDRQHAILHHHGARGDVAKVAEVQLRRKRWQRQKNRGGRPCGKNELLSDALGVIGT